MPYKFLENIAIADVAFEASGNNLSELFESAALAVTNTMVKNLDSVKAKVEKAIDLEADDVEILLFNFLQEIIFLKDAEKLLLSKVKANVVEKNGKFRIKAKIKGEELDPNRHELLVDVKAVTMHLFEVKKERRTWKARVVLDV